jgi:hypothetical protein
MRYGYRVGPDGALGKSAEGALHDMSRRQMAVDLGSVKKSERDLRRHMEDQNTQSETGDMVRANAAHNRTNREMKKLHRQGKMTGFPGKKDDVEPYSRTYRSEKDEDTLDARDKVSAAKKVMTKEQVSQGEQRKKENPHLPDLEDTAKRRLSPAKKTDWHVFGYGGEATVRHPKVGKKERVVGIDIDNPHGAKTVGGEKVGRSQEKLDAGDRYIASRTNDQRAKRMATERLEKKSMTLEEATSIVKGSYGPEGDPKKQVPPPAPKGEDSEPAQQPHYEDAAEVVLKKIAAKNKKALSPESQRHKDADDRGEIAHLGSSKKIDREHKEHKS